MRDPAHTRGIRVGARVRHALAIARNHENPEIEQLIEEHERFAVVETVSGEAAKLARRSYPRQWRVQTGVQVHAEELPIPGYHQLDDKEVGARLHELSQVELAAVETYERSHEDRPEVLDKLRYMRRGEPLPGYDALNPEQIVSALAGADAGTVKAVRDHERKFGHRPDVLEEAMRVLPTARASAGDARAHDERDARVRKGLAGRDKTVRG